MHGQEWLCHQRRFDQLRLAYFACRWGRPRESWAFRTRPVRVASAHRDLYGVGCSRCRHIPTTAPEPCNGTTAVQGFVHVDGSSTVNLYSMVSASMRVKYSVIFRVSALALR